MLLGSTMLEVAIGLIFVYLLMSLLCSAINEYIELKLNNRAKDLEKGIRMLLNDPDGSGLARMLYNHPLIKGLYQHGGRLPSYIPSRTFSLALWNLATASTEEATAAGVTMNLPAIRRTVASKVPDAEVRTAILTLIDEAGDDLERARDNIEAWFNAAMDRVSGWYKRRAQKFLIVIGLVAAILTNADTISIGKALALDPTLRSSMVAASQSGAGNAMADTRSLEERMQAEAATLNQMGLPIGWAFNRSFRQDPRGVPQSFGLDAVFWLILKLVGLGLTALAVSQGAPFWFDLLNKFIVIRSTVKPSEKSRDQPSKDRPAPKTEIEKKGEREEENKG